MQIFTWHDIERKINKAKWPKSWNRVDVYHDEVVINICPEIHDSGEDKQLFENIFEKFFDGESIEIEFDHTKLTVLYEEGDQTDRFRRADAPLFKDISLENKSESKVPKLPGAPVMAFHSYKGGVGRTLSLIALAKGIAELYGDKKKVLIIDSDLEAPGLTWMINGGQEHAAISYLDVLSLMHFHDINTELAEKIAGLVRKSSLTISTEKLETEHYFLPVYREKEQLLDIFSSPEKIIANQNNKYIISEFLSMIGAALEADIVLVDLRAGVTEFSAPFLFDPRVQKYFVTSTSMQSIKGTQMLLEEIQQKISGNLWESKILLTMIPPEMEENTIRQIEDELLEAIEREIDSKDTTILREDYLVRVRFDSPFISLGEFSQICSMLKGKRLLDIMEENAESIFDNGQEADGAILPLREVRETLQRLHNLAAAEITAEGTKSMNMLATASIREIVKDYQDEVPQIAVLGEKGSGKTYLYKQMLAAKTWAGFRRNLKKEDVEESRETFILPLISTINMKYIHPLAVECIQNANQAFGEDFYDVHSVNKNYNEILTYIDEKHTLAEWTRKWTDLLCGMAEESSTLMQIDKYLEERKKRLLFVADGLEDLFMDAQVQEGDSWKYAVRSLCQNVMNEIRNLKYGNVGMIVFIRSDMAAEAIGVNFEQFKNQYFRYELNWSPTEALRLAVWIAAQVNSRFAENIDILKASREALEERLELLWGKKLGKNHSREAASSRWIIAALSDFNRHLQARDIVRFLKFSTENLPGSASEYLDRFIVPAEIRQAIPKCSKEKLAEIKTEMKSIYQILERLMNMSEEEKRLPLLLDKINLTGEEISKLENQGYLISLDKKYYLPEIIRTAFGFRYEKGARPRVLSLLKG